VGGRPVIGAFSLFIVGVGVSVSVVVGGAQSDRGGARPVGRASSGA
jgi:hypothetical protein